MIFTFDGDAAGQKAALRAFERRPELRLPDLRRHRARRPRPVRPADQEGRRGGARAGGPAGAALPLRAQPTSSASTTSTAPTAGSTRVREAARLVSSIRDKSKVDAFARELAGMVGVDIERGPDRGTPRRQPRRPGRRDAAPGRPPRRSRPSSRRASSCPTCATRGSRIERETLKLVIQHPAAVGRTASDVGPNDFTPPDLPRGLGARRRRRRPGRRRRRPGLGVAAARRRRPTRPSPRRSARSASSRC